MAHGLTYKAAGIDIELKQRLVPMFRRLARPTLGAQVLEGIGGFGALVSLDGARAMRSPVLVAGTDGVGTKLKIAFLTGRHDTVGIDCVAMCVNDIVCHAARPLFFLDYIATGKLSSAVALALVKGVARGCRMAGMSLVGGETAQMPGFYRPGEYDIAGFAVGVAERARIPRPERIGAGDVLIGLASSGLHSNGFSLARRVLLERARLRLNGRVSELGCTLGEELLRPTKIYAKIAVELFERFPIRGLANITGGGVIENLPRVLPRGARAVIRRGSWQVPPIFDLIARLGRIDTAEMDRTFNNGLGMIAVVPSAAADAVVAHLRRRRTPARVVGEIRRGERGVVIG
ncbi:MAG TPA: phosphoribosylformylglycinamidine cyclo-ligase [Candidatus Binataceae bacterium]|jgi:phosphoribosylformylglycinamidine cyclo-ligase|nr:phosphoribosylformylglycinamidine cyclo-ligase [Candidatus Binataceae bacterium]